MFSCGDRNDRQAPEVEEQLIQTAVRGADYAPQINSEEEKRIYTTALTGLLKTARDQIALSDKYYSEDVRMLYLKGFFFKSLRELESAQKYFEKAHEISPMKQQISFELISTYLQQGKLKEGYDLALATYLSAPEYNASQVIFAVASIYNKKETEATEILKERGHNFPGAVPDVINAYLSIRNYAKARALLLEYKRNNPEEAANVDQLLQQIDSNR